MRMACGFMVLAVAAHADPRAEAVERIVREQVALHHIKAAIVRVTENGRELANLAIGESMTGVPATPDMHFRNGAVAISYVATVLLQLVDEGRVRLDDRVSKWLPELPHARRVTLEQLARMTSGYRDYVLGNAAFGAEAFRDPFKHWTVQELLAHAHLEDLAFEPGTNWAYAHTNYVILGLALEKITGRRMEDLMRERIFRPLNLSNTDDPGSPWIKPPVLHAFSSERRELFGIPSGTRFYEESTYWNPSWTITRGAIQYSDIRDVATSIEAIGTGRLVSPASHRAQIAPTLRGFGKPIPGVLTARTQIPFYTYGIGVVISGDWLLQNPMFAGAAGVAAYLPSRRLTIAAEVTLDEAGFGPDGGSRNQADALFRALGARLAPEAPPPLPPR